MRLFATADLHLSLNKTKPMEVFGPQWKDHHLKIKENWEREVEEQDVVLICGDISWAMTLEEALADLEFIENLPGKKIIIRGNHDYWWKGINKVRKALPSSISAIQNDSLLLQDGTAVCGSRGWLVPNGGNLTERDSKIYKRELNRVKLSLEDAQKKNPRRIVVMMHYPPFKRLAGKSYFEELFHKYNVSKCFYGHLHANDQVYAYNGIKAGVEYRLVACDYLEFKLFRACRMNEDKA